MKDFPLWRSPRAAAISALIVAGPLLLCAFSPALGAYAVAICLFLLPVAACTAGLVGGALPMMAGAAAGLYSLYRLFGTVGLTLGAVYLLPILAAFVIVILLRVPFWKGCGVMIGVHLLSLAGVYALLNNLAEGDLYAAAGEWAVSALKDSAVGDSLLYQLYSMGFISLREELAEKALLPSLLGYGYTLSPAARTDMLLSVNALVREGLTALVPNVLVSQSILGGVGCLLLPLRFGFLAEERRAFRSSGGPDTPDGALSFPDLGMPPLSVWYLPRSVGWQVGAALIAGYLLRRSVNPTLSLAGVILYAAASSLFMIQGAALLNFTQKAKGSPRALRVIVPVLLMLLSVLKFIGILDQFVNIRGLRKPRQPKEEQ